MSDVVALIGNPRPGSRTRTLAEATATGEAVFTSLDAIRTVPADGADGAPPARIVLLSDGYRTSGRSVEDAAAAALAANVPVSTIAFGTDTGVVDIRGQLQRVPVDRLSLQQLAETTKGAPEHLLGWYTDGKFDRAPGGAPGGHPVVRRGGAAARPGGGGDESAVDLTPALITNCRGPARTAPPPRRRRW